MSDVLEIKIAGETYFLDEYQVDLLYEYILIVERMKRDAVLNSIFYILLLLAEEAKTMRKELEIKACEICGWDRVSIAKGEDRYNPQETVYSVVVIEDHEVKDPIVLGLTWEDCIKNLHTIVDKRSEGHLY